MWVSIFILEFYVIEFMSSPSVLQHPFSTFSVTYVILFVGSFPTTHLTLGGIYQETGT